MQSPSDNGSTGSGATVATSLPVFDAADLFNFTGVDIPSGEEIYDRLMGAIEPELTSKNVGLLKAKYASETPENKQLRAERYTKAYAEYERQYAKFRSTRDETMHRYKAEALKSLEANERKEEQTDVLDLENQILSA